MLILLFDSLCAFVATLAFAILFQVPKKCIIATSICGALSYLLYASLNQRFEFEAMFIASCAASLLSEVCARQFRVPVTVFLAAALIPLVPGYSFFTAIKHLLESNAVEALQNFRQTALNVGALSLGILLVSSIFRLIPRRKA